MPRIRIKQLDERVATSGLHFGRGPQARKLEPGEVVDIPEGEFFDMLWATGKLDLTMDPVTRPLEYADYSEAMLCSPSFKAHGEDDLERSNKARAVVAARIVETLPDEPPEKKVVEKTKSAAPAKPKEPVNPRVARRKKVSDEQSVST